jgi:hypothetical protein
MVDKKHLVIAVIAILAVAAVKNLPVLKDKIGIYL